MKTIADLDINTSWFCERDIMVRITKRAQQSVELEHPEDAIQYLAWEDTQKIQVVCQPIPTDLETKLQSRSDMFKPKLCYMNALFASLMTGCDYVEGYNRWLKKYKKL